FVRVLQHRLFGIASQAGESLSVKMLILVTSLSFLASFLCVHVLPDQRDTAVDEGGEAAHPGPERWTVLPSRWRNATNTLVCVLGALAFYVLYFVANFELIAAFLVTFFGATLIRKTTLDAALRHVGS